MKRSIIVILAITLVCALFVACANEPQQDTPKAMSLVIRESGKPNSRGLQVDNPDYDYKSYDELYWTYKAVKVTSEGPFTTGQQLTETDLNGGKTGLPGKFGPFSMGGWKFTINAYTDSAKQNMYFQGIETKVTIDESNNVVAVTVDLKQAIGDTGTVVIKNITFKNKNEASSNIGIPENYKIYLKLDSMNSEVEDTTRAITTADGYTLNNVPAGTRNLTAYLRDENGNNWATEEYSFYVKANLTYTVDGFLEEGETIDGVLITDKVTDINNLQSVITKAKAGAVIFIPKGDYTINKDITIDKPLTLMGEVGLTKPTFTGNYELKISDAVADGDVLLKGLEINGKLYVQGGGSNSIHLYNTTVTNIEMAKERTETASQLPRLALQNSRVTETLLVSKAAIVEADKASAITVTDAKAEVVVFGEDTDLGNTTEGSDQYIKVGKVQVGNSYYDSFAEAVTNAVDGDTIKLLQDVSIEEQLETSKNLTIDLNENTLSMSACFILQANNNVYCVTISNGNIKANIQTTKLQDATIAIYSNSQLKLKDVHMTSNITGLFAYKCENNMLIELDNSEVDVEGYYAIGTNATKVESSDVQFIIKNSTITSAGGPTDGDNTAILFNVKGHVEIENSIIKGDRQAVILRGGEGHKITNSTLVATANNKITDFKLESAWGDGNNVPLAALVIGNRSTSYPYPTSVTLDNATVTVENDSNKKNYHTSIYVYQQDATADRAVSVSGTLSKTSDTTVNSDMNGASYSVTPVTPVILVSDKPILDDFNAIADSVFNKIVPGENNDKKEWSAAEIANKLNVSEDIFYVNVGKPSEEVASLTLLGKKYAKDSVVKVSIGMSAFFVDSAFKTDKDGNLLIASVPLEIAAIASQRFLLMIMSK